MCNSYCCQIAYKVEETDHDPNLSDKHRVPINFLLYIT